MTTTELTFSSPLQEIRELINSKNYLLAEEKLNTLSSNSGEWHFLYSIIMLSRSWFDSARDHLQQAVSFEPENLEYQETLAKFVRRHNHYTDDYYREPYRRRRHGSCCCCCDCCDCCDCDISCCDLICADTCCECMGGDLIECI